LLFLLCENPMVTANGSYEFFDHAADVGIRILARSLEGLFATAARALMDWIGSAPEGRPVSGLEVRVQAEDIEDLLVRWLQELIYQFQCRHTYITEVSNVRLVGYELKATLAGIIWDENARQEYREVKAVTYHQLSVRQDQGFWEARVILDV